MSKQERDKLLLTLHNFKTELFLSYVDMKFEAVITSHKSLVCSQMLFKQFYKYPYLLPNLPNFNANLGQQLAPQLGKQRDQNHWIIKWKRPFGKTYKKLKMNVQD
ncbi:hypothetical protein RhiirA4_458690 [Rhizophagus irregularis]|uniref:Uncharacterized protein n=1 Tax=Rhizophagus irregularis TaxID=588596 RepID=A0A2I1GCP5_9GLOM|nr:hypothetical protein RhiirA4_458690 [Rhizophagus irregularis]